MPNFVLQHDLDTTFITANNHASGRVYEHITRDLQNAGWTRHQYSCWRRDNITAAQAIVKGPPDELVPSSCSVKEEAAKVVAETNAYLEVIADNEDESCSANKKTTKKKQKRTPYVLTTEHEEYRRLLDAHEKWEKELTTMHGLSRPRRVWCLTLSRNMVSRKCFQRKTPKKAPSTCSWHVRDGSNSDPS
jgi:hypothetical protein